MAIIRADYLGGSPKYLRDFWTGLDDWRSGSQVRRRKSALASGDVNYDYPSMETVMRMGVAGYLNLMMVGRLTDDVAN